jgi:hypothetical protein
MSCASDSLLLPEWCSVAEQLLDREEGAEKELEERLLAGRSGTIGAVALTSSPVDGAVETDDAADVGWVGRVAEGRPLKLNLELVDVASGLMRAGERALRKSRYAGGGVMGVFSPSSRFTKVGVRASKGLWSSEGYVAERGVERAVRAGFAVAVVAILNAAVLPCFK